jgi:hypothetical protein
MFLSEINGGLLSAVSAYQFQTKYMRRSSIVIYIILRLINSLWPLSSLSPEMPLGCAITELAGRTFCHHQSGDRFDICQLGHYI